MDIRKYFNRVRNENGMNHEIETTIESLSVADESPLIESNSITVGDSIATNPMEYEYIPGKRKGSKLVYMNEDKYIFAPINNDPKNGKRYGCSSVGCPAKIIIRPSGICEIPKRSKPHIAHSDHSQKKLRIHAQMLMHCVAVMV